MKVSKNEKAVNKNPGAGSNGISLNDNRPNPIQKKDHAKGCGCSSCQSSTQLKSSVIQAKRNKLKTSYNEMIKGTSSARMAYTKSSGISLASMHMTGIMPDGSKKNLSFSHGESGESSNRSDIYYLKGVLPSKGNEAEGGGRWNDAEINALAKLDYKLYDVDPRSFQSFIFSVKTSIHMCKYCRRRLNYWKNQLQRDWGKPIQTIYTT